MKIQIKPTTHNAYPFEGLFIRGASIAIWAKEIESLAINISQYPVYALPGQTPHSVWGCFILFNQSIPIKSIGLHTKAQKVNQHFFIPEGAEVFPAVDQEEYNRLLKGNIHVLHPETGLVELEQPIAWEELLEAPQPSSLLVKKPKEGVYIPDTILRYQVRSLSPEKVLDKLDKELESQQKKFDNTPLDDEEKKKLAFYKKYYFKKTSSSNGSDEQYEPTKMMNLFAKLQGKGTDWINKERENLENLEERNKKEVDKLLDMFEKDPEEALKYAIPLDEQGTTRGEEAAFELSKRWGDLSSLTGSGTGLTGNSTVDLGDHFQTLREKYEKAAQAFIEKGEYKKAAFIFLKLLKEYFRAAQTLEKGKFWQEAASIYVKNAKDQKNAARCYEEGKHYTEAIELYAELKEWGKAGDLAMLINEVEEARGYYEQFANQYIDNNQYVKASLVYKQKLNEPHRGQALLLKGWRNQKDAENCLVNYLKNIELDKKRWEEIQKIYKEDVSSTHRLMFLNVLKHQFVKKNPFADGVRNIAYEMISSDAKKNVKVLDYLPHFNHQDKLLSKDIMQYKINKK